MAENYTPNKMELSDIHGGVKYENGKAPDVNDFNKMVEGIAFAQENGGGAKLYLHKVTVKPPNGGTSKILFLSKSDTPFGYENTDPNVSTTHYFSLPYSYLPIYIDNNLISAYMQVYYNAVQMVYFDVAGGLNARTVEYVGGDYDIDEY